MVRIYVCRMRGSELVCMAHTRWPVVVGSAAMVAKASSISLVAGHLDADFSSVIFQMYARMLIGT